MRARRFVPPAWSVALGLSLICALLALSLPEPSHRLEYTLIKNQRGTPLRVIVHFPEPALYARAPAAVLCQPVNSPPESARLLALELVGEGFVVLTFDWRGRVPGENRQLLRTGAREALRSDAVAAVNYLRGLAGVNPEHVVIAGHSVGGTLAIEAAADDPRIAGVASIGMEADVAPDRPRNLLWALGLYDEFRVLNRMRDVFQSSAATSSMENTTVGDFARGTARRLGVSPTADHFTELQDREIHREVLKWFRRAVGLRDQPRRLWMEARGLLLLAAWLAAVLGALMALRRAASDRPWRLRGAAAVALLGLMLLSRVRGPHFLLATDAILWLVVFTLLAGFICTREREALDRGLRFAARAAFVAWASLFLTLVVNNVANYVHEPRYLLWLPEFVLRHGLDGLYAYLMVYSRPLLFSVYDPQTVAPRAWVYVVLGIEAFSPGLLLGLVSRLSRRRAGPVSSGRQRRVLSGAILLGLLVVLAGIAWMRV